MPAIDFRLSDADIADLVAFIRSACGKHGAPMAVNRATQLGRKRRAERDPAGAR
ncbi:hypothetical protein [Cupriavidus pauculus]|uniref:hypothetical protein n=1 Tax=Cupriavidus pauculus TaxID=82633 RepID=UPI0015DE2F5E|nr:hypothetical protein [Cupriavidus pauculus]